MRFIRKCAFSTLDRAISGEISRDKGVAVCSFLLPAACVLVYGSVCVWFVPLPRTMQVFKVGGVVCVTYLTSASA